eukprot:COSAG05_NODE_157_length_15666_cov_29.830410_9_plen_186_part_00
MYSVRTPLASCASALSRSASAFASSNSRISLSAISRASCASCFSFSAVALSSSSSSKGSVNVDVPPARQPPPYNSTMLAEQNPYRASTASPRSFLAAATASTASCFSFAAVALASFASCISFSAILSAASARDSLSKRARFFCLTRCSARSSSCASPSWIPAPQAATIARPNPHHARQRSVRQRP